MNAMFAVLSKGPNFGNMGGYNTLEQEWDDGALVLAYGLFLEQVANFLGISLTLYTLAQICMFASHNEIIKKSMKCRYFRKCISEKALRCVNCSSWQDGREDVHASSS
ncbi:hypothetical protein BDW67DRAFT_55620 [Aspergillus spinulosporus]